LTVLPTMLQVFFSVKEIYTGFHCLLTTWYRLEVVELSVIRSVF